MDYSANLPIGKKLWGKLDYIDHIQKQTDWLTDRGEKSLTRPRSPIGEICYRHSGSLTPAPPDHLRRRYVPLFGRKRDFESQLSCYN
jgi:hypothetical protein